LDIDNLNGFKLREVVGSPKIRYERMYLSKDCISFTAVKLTIKTAFARLITCVRKGLKTAQSFANISVYVTALTILLLSV
jgi:hypothetical protein